MRWIDKRLGPPQGGVTQPHYSGSTFPQSLTWQENEQLLSELLATSPEGEHKAHAAARYGQVKSDPVNPVLLTEQHHLCVYCERRIQHPVTRGERGKSIRRAHWVPISVDPSQGVRWTNLHASCSTADSCDRAQGDLDLQMMPPSQWWPGIEFLTCGGDGILLVSPHAPESMRPALKKALGPGGMDSSSERSLNLNNTALVQARLGAIEAVTDWLRRGISPAERVARAHELLESPIREPYITTIVSAIRTIPGYVGVPVLFAGNPRLLAQLPPCCSGCLGDADGSVSITDAVNHIQLAVPTCRQCRRAAASQTLRRVRGALLSALILSAVATVYLSSIHGAILSIVLFLYSVIAHFEMSGRQIASLTEGTFVFRRHEYGSLFGSANALLPEQIAAELTRMKDAPKAD